MRLTVKQDDSTINEFQFNSGPVYIGRHANSQIYLGHRAVSRQHAVIFQTQDGKWMVEDLDSTNKTFLNDEAIHKGEIKTGDVLRIVDFIIEVDLEQEEKPHKPINLEDTLTKTAYNLDANLIMAAPDVIVRELEAGHAPAVKLSAKRLADFSRATESIAKASDIDELLLTLLSIALEQFDAQRAWGALRKQPSGPMTAHAGRERNGGSLELGNIKVGERINQAIENGQYLVVPLLAAQLEGEEEIGSAMIAPIMRPFGCFGILYLDNTADGPRYNIGDLDYLMMITIHTAATLKRL
ncbi:MAG: FHA domain-containing protein [Planctomycetota bacterium]|jgi:pSer/pThr/pTyr-binding forkhead associated (FHA) protein